jgi:carbamoyl-phosphate synthase large subunit
MPDTLTVLVLGVGGNVSQGILKALAMSSLHLRVVGACVSPRAFGLYTVDTAYFSPPAAAPSFLSWLLTVCRRERVQAILSGVEPVLDVLAENAETIRAETDAIPIVSDSATLDIGNNKLTTCHWLTANGFNAPRSAKSTDSDGVARLVNSDCGYPLIAKPCRGKGGRIFTVRNDTDLAWAVAQADYLLQEYLGGDDEEYTVGTFSDRDGRLAGSIVMRRRLLEGTTVWAELGEFPAVRTEAERIASALRPLGPCNIQLRMSNGSPVCFEINVRFSGTTPIRAHYGWNDVEATLRHYVLDEPVPPLPHITEGAVARYWNEGYVSIPSYYAARRTPRGVPIGESLVIDVGTYGKKPWR